MTRRYPPMTKDLPAPKPKRRKISLAERFWTKYEPEPGEEHFGIPPFLARQRNPA
jgi:hypothetical protein